MEGIYILGIILLISIPSIICCIMYINDIDKPKQESKYYRV